MVKSSRQRSLKVSSSEMKCEGEMEFAQRLQQEFVYILMLPVVIEKISLAGRPGCRAKQCQPARVLDFRLQPSSFC